MSKSSYEISRDCHSVARPFSSSTYTSNVQFLVALGLDEETAKAMEDFVATHFSGICNTSVPDWIRLGIFERPVGRETVFNYQYVVNNDEEFYLELLRDLFVRFPLVKYVPRLAVDEYLFLVGLFGARLRKKQLSQTLKNAYFDEKSRYRYLDADCLIYAIQSFGLPSEKDMIDILSHMEKEDTNDLVQMFFERFPLGVNGHTLFPTDPEYLVRLAEEYNQILPLKVPRHIRATMAYFVVKSGVVKASGR